jgi:hypothetical protein
LDKTMKSEIKLPTVPYGEYCMMQPVSQSASLDSNHSKHSVCCSLSLLTFKLQTQTEHLQFMGLAYLTYGGGSKIHADARGQMDSGHICLKGYNHVVILRRLGLNTVKECTDQLTLAGQRDLRNEAEPVGTTVLHAAYDDFGLQNVCDQASIYLVTSAISVYLCCVAGRLLLAE